MEIRIIQNKRDHKAALLEIERLWTAPDKSTPMATSNSPTYGQSNSPMAGQLDYAESEAIAIREAASFIR